MRALALALLFAAPALAQPVASGSEPASCTATVPMPTVSGDATASILVLPLGTPAPVAMPTWCDDSATTSVLPPGVRFRSGPALLDPTDYDTLSDDSLLDRYPYHALRDSLLLERRPAESLRRPEFSEPLRISGPAGMGLNGGG